MITDREFLKPEVRDGFFVPSEIKQAWACEIEVLKEVAKICKKHDIPWFASWGTLLGAVRHKGFIPWDDDIDISMARPDYERFLRIAPDELPDGYMIYNHRNCEGFRQFNTRITCADRISFDGEHLERFAGFPYMCGIDIFAFDYVSKDIEEEKAKCNEADFVLSFADCLFLDTLSPEDKKTHFKTIKDLYGVEVPADATKWETQAILLKLVDKIISRVQKKDASGLIQVISMEIRNPGKQFPLEAFEKAVEMPFENITIPVPAGYDAVLRVHYGDYTVIRKDVSGHNYPFFESQKEELKKLAGEDIFAYSFKEEDFIKNKDESSSFKALAADCLKAMPELLDKMFAGDADAVSELKQLCGDLKALIDNVLGAGSGSAKILGRMIAVLDGPAGSEDCLPQARETLKDIGELMEEEIFSKKIVLFLCAERDRFKCFEAEYKKYAEADDAYVYVMMIPWGYKKYDGTLTDVRVEEAPDGVFAFGPDSLDIDLLCPDVIFTQDAYDDRNPVMSVHPAFYCRNLKNLTDRLVYVPSLEPGDFERVEARSYQNMKYYCTVPGVAACDEIILSSQTVKERYVEKLTEFTAGISIPGGTGDNKDYWEKKITVR